jgi:hypothetical protein
MMNQHVSSDRFESVCELKDEERQPCEVWTRVMGYFRPVSSFNLGKKGEFAERTYFAEAKAKLD